MSDIDLAIKGSKKIEAILRAKFNAEGRGLHELLSNVEIQLPADLVRMIRYIASIRNSVVHEEDSKIEDPEQFQLSVERVVSGLDALIKLRQEALAKQHDALRSNQSVNKPPMEVQHRTPVWVWALLLMFVSISYSINERNNLLSQRVIIAQTEIENLNNRISILQAKERTNKTEPQKTEIAHPKDSIATNLSIKSDTKNADPDLFRAQTRLKVLNYSIGVPDGIWGPSTKSSIRAFQITNGLPSSGELDTKTETKLFSDNAIPKIVEESLETKPGKDSGIDTEKHSIPVGSLLDKAKDGDKAYKLAIADLELNVFEYIRINTRTTLGEVSVRTNKEGKHELLVPVSWVVPHQSIVSALSKYFVSYQGRPLEYGSVDFSDHMGANSQGIKIDRFSNSRSDQKSLYSTQLFDKMVARSIKLQVSAGARTNSITIASGRSCHVRCSGVGNDQFHINYSNGVGRTPLILEYTEQNPIVISGFTKEELEKVGDVKIEVVVSP